MARYELSGEFFWTIDIADATVRTSVGKIGNNGHTRIKSYGSPAEAKREYAAAVAEKLEQGYALIGAPVKTATAAKPMKKPAVKKKPAAKR